MVKTIPRHLGQAVWNNLYPYCSALLGSKARWQIVYGNGSCPRLTP